MFQYHKTSGDRGEICGERAGNFIGFIVNQGRADRWAAYTRPLELIGDRYGSRAQAVTACYHRCSGERKIPTGDIVATEPT
jgi:hypothetical protein